MTNQNLTLTAVNPDQLKDLIVEGIREEFKELISQLTPQKNQEELLTRKEVCTILQCSMTTLWHWDNKDLLKPVRIGRNVRYRKSDVDVFINSKNQEL
ncbi:helix-turn-helix transcriptional regulator [Psychroserpens sp. XS_ASV72]|uniref:helix-turn-helix transcriptional regulator n=1 Tax=Psychroserpens sp. XS_ASV72 TaxID=3241293 RepID=UPI0035180BEC